MAPSPTLTAMAAVITRRMPRAFSLIKVICSSQNGLASPRMCDGVEDSGFSVQKSEEVGDGVPIKGPDAKPWCLKWSETDPSPIRSAATASCLLGFLLG